MSKIALEPNASGTGTFTIASPNSNTSRTLTLPDADGVLLTADNLPSGGVTLLGTLATTSGTSVTLSSLDLTSYSTLYFVIDGVHAASASVGARVEINSFAMSRLFGSSPARPTTGLSYVDLATGFGQSGTTTLQDGAYYTATGHGFNSGLTTSSTSITFTASADSFGAGSIKVYGVA